MYSIWEAIKATRQTYRINCLTWWPPSMPVHTISILQFVILMLVFVFLCVCVCVLVVLVISLYCKTLCTCVSGNKEFCILYLVRCVKFKQSSLKNKTFKILTLRGPRQPKRGIQTKKFQLIWFLVYIINLVWNFEHSSFKTKIFKILKLWGPGPPKRGSQTKKFQKIFILVYTIYVVWNFEHSSLKNDDFKILTFRGPASPNGAPKPKNFKRYDFWFTWSMLCEILSHLA